jgi:hypothetical protein
MDDITKKLGIETEPDKDAVTWGENKEERILDRSPHHKSARHECKGPGCNHAFEKL